MATKKRVVDFSNLGKKPSHLPKNHPIPGKVSKKTAKKKLPTITQVVPRLIEMGSSDVRPHRQKIADLLQRTDHNSKFQRTRVLTTIEMILEMLS